MMHFFRSPHQRSRCRPGAAASYRLDVELLENRVLLASYTISVDATAGAHPISPLIYGQNYVDFGSTADAATERALNSPLTRYGGNLASTYNYLDDSANHNNDFFFESIANGGGTAGTVNSFISNTRAGGAQPDVTIPMLPYVAQTNGGAITYSYHKMSYPAQDSYDNEPQFGADPPGDGLTAGARQPILDTNLSLDYTPNSPAFEQGLLQDIVNNFPGQVPFITLDNEPDIWSSTHQDVEPNGMHADTYLQTFQQYAQLVKNNDTAAQILGPEVSGYLGYIYSSYDNWYESQPSINFDTVDFPPRDRNSIMGGKDFIPYFLQQMAAGDAAFGQRTLDYLTVHYYPQGGSPNQNTRSLWDPNYVDPSFINTQIDLIPRLQNWVNTYYPGTKTGITEYNFDTNTGTDPTNGTSQADVLGIFGRQGLDMADRFNAPDPSDPAYSAFQIYRNYDGHDSPFGDTSASTTFSSNADDLSAFGALRSTDGAMTVMAVNKDAFDNTVTLNLSDYTPGSTAQVWQFSGSSGISRLADIPITGNSMTLDLPSQSVTLFVIAKGSSSTPDTTPPSTVITAMPPAQSNSATAIFSFTGSDNVTPPARLTFQVSVDGSAFTAATSPITYTGLSNGMHTFAVRAIDQAGNIDPTPATFNWDIDTNTSGPPGSSFDELGAYRPSDGSWSLDSNGQFGFQTGGPEGQTPLSDRVITSFSPASSTIQPVSGDWAKSGTAEIGDFNNGTWDLDLNNNGTVNAGETFRFGQAGDIAVPGNYLPGGGIELAVFRSFFNLGYGEFFISDQNWLAEDLAGQTIGIAESFIFGAAGDRVVVGDWNGLGLTEVGVFRSAAAFGNPNAAVFTLDVNNVHDFTKDPGKVFIFGIITDQVVIGDWDGSGTSKVGVYRPATAFNAPNTAVFSLDEHGDLDFTKDGNVFLFGLPTDKYVTGRWAYTTSVSGSAIPSTAAALLTDPLTTNGHDNPTAAS